MIPSNKYKKDFTEKELKKARLRLLMDYHPDKDGSQKDFMIIEKGYEILSDTKRKNQYNHNKVNIGIINKERRYILHQSDHINFNKQTQTLSA